MTHTPAPWEHNGTAPHGDEIGFSATAIWAGEGNRRLMVALVTGEHVLSRRPGGPEQRANAALIAAAPEMLAAAKVLLATAPAFRLRPIGGEGSRARLEQQDHIAAEDALRAAIAKAEGNQ